MVQHFIHILDDLRYGYRKGYNRQVLLTKCMEDWKAALDHRDIVGFIFMDLSKAFDCIPHYLLVAKVRAYVFIYFFFKFFYTMVTCANGGNELR